MNKRTSNWLIVSIILAIGFFAVGIIFTIIGWEKKQGEQAIEAAYNQGYQEGYDRGYQEAWKVGYDTGFTDGQAPYKASSDNVISLEKALAIIAKGKSNHLYWANHPELQTKETGDTAFNLMWEGYYNDIGELLKWQDSQLYKYYTSPIAPPVSPPR